MIAAIIQARMGSRRFHGKALEPICGKPMLQHIIERCQASSVDKTIVATTYNDWEIAEFCRSIGVECFMGHADNVLQRMWEAAKTANCDGVVRVNGDSPMIEPEKIDEVSYDWAMNLCRTRRRYTAFTVNGTASVLTRYALPEFISREGLFFLLGYQRLCQEHVTFALHSPPAIPTKWIPLHFRDYSPPPDTVVDRAEDIPRIERMMQQCDSKSATIG